MRVPSAMCTPTEHPNDVLTSLGLPAIMTQPNEEPVPVRKLYITTLKMSSVFLQSYPETSPWDLDTVGVTDLHPPLEVLQPTICPLDDRVKALALAGSCASATNGSQPFLLHVLERPVLPRQLGLGNSTFASERLPSAAHFAVFRNLFWAHL